jgi:YbbR domain-containing protein
MAIGLGTVIVLMLGWSISLFFGSSGEVNLKYDKKVDQVQFEVAKAVMSEKNKMKFQGLTILASVDGTKVEITGSVGKKEDIDELKTIVDGATGGFPSTVDVKVVPRRSGL